LIQNHTVGHYFWGTFRLKNLLKAVYVSKHKKHAPFLHNLYRLAELSNISLTEEQSDWLDKITSFNMNARYDDYKKRISDAVYSGFCQRMD
jgi:hypothetical protein